MTKIFTIGSSQVVLMVKNISAHTGNIRDAGLIPGLGRSPGESHGQRSLEGHSPWVHKESNKTEVIEHASIININFICFF